METTTVISELVHRVRRIVEEVAPNIYNPLGTFPTGWCQDCSRVLGQLFDDANLHGFKLVSGARGEHGQSSHVWLKRGNLIVDITADQFIGENGAAVVVSSVSAWHAQWTCVETELDELVVTGIEGQLYEAVKQHPSWIFNASTFAAPPPRPNASETGIGHMRRSRDADIPIIDAWLPKNDTVPSMRNNWNLSKRAHEKNRMLVWEDEITQIPIAYFWGTLNSRDSLIDVHPAHRRRGIGRAFVEQLIEVSRERGELLLEFECAPESSVSFWKGMGFKVSSEGQSMSGRTYIARTILKQKKELPEGTRCPVTVRFLPEHAAHVQSFVAPLVEYSLLAAKNTAGTLSLNERVAYFDQPDGRDLVVEIIVEGKRLCREKAKYSRPSALGVFRCENGFAVDTIDINGCSESED